MRRNKGLCMLLAVVMLCCLTGCTGETPETSGTPKTPETSGTPKTSLYVGSLDTGGLIIDAPVFGSLQEMEEASLLVVVGQITGESETIYHEKQDWYTTIHTVTVQETIKGEPLQTIKVFQLGTADSDAYETKIKKGIPHILFLAKNHVQKTADGAEEIVYTSISSEQGFFAIDDGKVKTYTRVGVSPQFDGMDVAKFKKEIQQCVKK